VSKWWWRCLYQGWYWFGDSDWLFLKFQGWWGRRLRFGKAGGGAGRWIRIRSAEEGRVRGVRGHGRDGGIDQGVVVGFKVD